MAMQSNPARFAALAAAALLAGCGEMKIKVWPFGGDTAIQERSRGPANATEYLCAGGKRIYLRRLDGGDAIWLILPERELRLDRIGTEGSRYGKGAMVLQLTGNDATLNDGAATPVTGCKAGVAEPAASAGDAINK
jgi:membrane-bound inhibitor of C-type lysozyme